MTYDFDLFTIGAGSGGVRASRIAALAGARVAVAEADRIGGTCVIRGCVPKKFFVYGGEYAQAFEDAAAFGWTVNATFDWATLRDNVAAEVTRLSGIYERNLRGAGVEPIAGRAALLDAHTVRMDDGRTFTAERILIAVGGAPYRPLDVPGQELAIVSDDAFNLAALPKRVAVFGGGYIACEFASIFQGVGVETQLIYRGPKVLRGFDEDIREHVQQELARTGVEVITGAAPTRIERAGAAYAISLSDGRRIETDLAMLAIGRAPKTANLGLERAGVKTDESGAIIVDAYAQTSASSVYAVGDVTDRINLTPVAIREGHAFADTVYNNRPTKFDHTDVATAVFTRPPVGVVGCNEYEARERHGQVDIYKTAFRPMKHVLAGNAQRMLMKLIVRRRDDVVVGVHIAGPDAPEIIQMAAIAVKAGLTKAQWDATCAVHPTVAEELVTLREKAPEPAAAPSAV
ncbi:MAG: glutathione-disulfide reductase [Hyphomonadaceae bacterium]